MDIRKKGFKILLVMVLDWFVLKIWNKKNLEFFFCDNNVKKF